MAAVPQQMGRLAVAPPGSGPRCRPPAGRPARKPAPAGSPHLRLVVEGEAELRIAAGERRARRLSGVVAALATVAGLACLWLGAGVLRAAGSGAAPRVLPGSVRVHGGYRYVARAGDSLWAIALRLEPDADPRPLVDALAAELHGAALRPGDVLVVP